MLDDEEMITLNFGGTNTFTFCCQVVVFKFNSRTFCAVTVIVLMQAPRAHVMIGYFLLSCI